MKVSDAVLAESSAPKFTDALRIDESVLVLGDVELPLHDAAFINKAMTVARHRGIERLLLAGDFIHWGALSVFPDSPNDASAEITQIETYLEPFVRPWKQVWWMKGNHDGRVGSAMDRLLTLEHGARLIVPPELADEFKRKVTCSDYFYAYVGNWLVEHPKATSRIPANAARVIALEQEGYSVAMAHNHLVGIQCVGKKRWAVETGCCVDPERLHYYMVRHNTRPKMRQGALMLIKRGDSFMPTLLTPDWTDWEWELRDAGEAGDEGEYNSAVMLADDLTDWERGNAW